MLKNTPPQATHIEDYRALPFQLEAIDLTFELDEEKTLVIAKSEFKAAAEAANGGEPLVLNGVDLNLIDIKVNNAPPAYTIDGDTLVIPSVPEVFTLEVVTEISPKENTALEGLYVSGDILCTQNEPEGFRHITYFLDRSDVMTKYTTTLIADKKRYPTLLSNGNPIDSGDGPNGTHWVKWHDPFLKPCYLFALVAGDLGMISDTFTTKSGRKIDLRIYCDHGQEGKCHHAMRSLKKSMKWDEEVFGLEYDLDIFMIVAVDSFNFGAMENKGLNIFNSSCALADERTATDDNFIRVEGVIAHEYFHNWTGNRVTCRDWFQLTLKEGLTVFRDQEFTADMNSRPVKRIEDVDILRRFQFAEDAGPTSHPIKPKSYLQINNFYTSTIYNKGAEVIRMIHTLIGHEAFCRGITTYFSLFDGQAVTTEDFLHAMEQASGYDLSKFSRWYHQSGTPHIVASYDYDPAAKTFSLTLEQKLSSTADQKEKKPLTCPIAFGLIGEEGSPLPLKIQGNGESAAMTKVLVLEEEKQSFLFEEIPTKPVPSFNRQFSAPVTFSAPYSANDLTFLMAHDTDSFNRWDAGQELMTNLLLDNLGNSDVHLDDNILGAYEALLKDSSLDPAFKAMAIALPGETIVGQRMEEIDFEGIHIARESVLTKLSSTFYDLFLTLYRENSSDEPYSLDPISMGKRALKNRCLAYLVQSERPEALALAHEQFKNATNMTDEFAALSVIANSTSSERKLCLDAFYSKWKEEHLVVCKWLAVQAASKLPNVLEAIKQLMSSNAYDDKVPNLVRSLLGSYIQNHVQFHSAEGYTFLAEQIAHLDSINPHIAAMLCGAFKKYPKVGKARQQMILPHVEKLLAIPTLSNNSYEILSKAVGRTAAKEKMQ